MQIGNINLYIVIVTYNGMKWIDKSISSCFNSTIPVRLVVVDNCSTDGTPDFIRKKYDNVHLISLDANLGFGKANNVGIRYAMSNGADYICLLNQDAYLHAEALAKLVDIFYKNKEYGVLSPMQMNGAGTALDKNFALNVFSSGNCPHYSQDVKENKTRDVYWLKFIMAAIWLVKRDVVNVVGYFSPIFSHYGEDGDYLNRVRYHGFQVGIVPEAIAYHDREGRKVEKIKQLRIDYVGVLSELTNINRNFLRRLGYALEFYLKNLRTTLSSKDVQLAMENTKLFVKQLSMIPTIIKTRRNNKKISNENSNIRL